MSKRNSQDRKIMLEVRRMTQHRRDVEGAERNGEVKFIPSPRARRWRPVRLTGMTWLTKKHTPGRLKAKTEYEKEMAVIIAKREAEALLSEAGNEGVVEVNAG